MPPSTSEPDSGAIKAAIVARAHEVGFDLVGVTSAAPDAETRAGLAEFLASGHHGSMAWLEDRRALRESPQGLWPDARSVIMVASNYGPEQNPLEALAHKDRGVVSVYAGGDDYHDVLKKRLKVVGRWMGETYGCALKVFVDTAPVMEKPLARRAGLGWQGKHTNLVSRVYGSWLFLGAIMTTLDLPPDRAEEDHCGACQACLDICPTKAFPEPYKIDARRCISYLTIEHKGPIDETLRPLLGNRIYGCDDCLAICPWNKFAQVSHEVAFHTREALKGPLLADLARLDDTAFRALFRKSPVKRIGRGRFVRNVLYAIGNSGDPALRSAAEALTGDEDPVVADAAEWAVRRLSPAASK